jgi:hypothetical protein
MSMDAMKVRYAGGPQDGKSGFITMDELQRGPQRMQMLGDPCGQCSVRPVLEDGQYAVDSVVLQWHPLPTAGVGVHAHAGAGQDDPDVAWLERQAVDVHRTFGVGWRVELLGYPSGPEFNGPTLHDAARQARVWAEANPVPPQVQAPVNMEDGLPVLPVLGSEI